MNGIDLLGLSFVVENTLCWDVNRIDMILCFFSEDILVYVKLRKSLNEWIKEGKVFKFNSVGAIFEPNEEN